MIILTYIMTALAIVGTVANSFRRKWCFYLWAVTNTFWCIYNAVNGEYALAIQYAFNFAMTIVGIVRWSREAKQEKKERMLGKIVIEYVKRAGRSNNRISSDMIDAVRYGLDLVNDTNMTENIQREEQAQNDKRTTGIVQTAESAYYLTLKLDALREERQMLEDLTQKLTADYSSDGTQAGGKKNTKEELSCKLADISSEIDRECAKVAEHIVRIKAVISKVKEPDLYAVLSRRYISYQTMGDIAEAMHYDRKTIQRKHKQALDVIMSLNVAP